MHEHLSFLGWIFMAGAWSGIIALNVFCFWRILSEKKEEIVDPLPPEVEKDP
jgi:hypothetical protein